MPKSNPNPSVDFFFTKAKKWRTEFEALRILALDSGLTEELKWGCPCYTLEKANIILIHGFKEYCALLFMKGALLKDEKGILVQQTQNVQSARQLRWTRLTEIEKQKATIKAYIKEAIAVEKAGLKIAFKAVAEYTMPEEFQQALDDMPELKKAFYQLTPGRQRGYLLHFSSPKQSQTRVSRIAKCVPAILKGKGLTD
jgi:uncharacterized protein YdeI (YjbR/CyaY-like superfamily)